VDAEAIYRQYAPATLIVEGVRTATGATLQGSGVCVDTRGYVLVTAHQAVGIKELRGRLQGGKEMPLSILAVDEAREMALLKADQPLPAAVPLGNARALRSGAPIVSIATPINLEFSTVLGNIAATNRTLGGHPVLQASLTATHGSSGGPVFDRQGRLIGLIRGELEEVAFTIINSINNAYPLLEQHGIPVPQGAGINEELLIPAPDITDTELRALNAYNHGVRTAIPEEKTRAYTMAVTLLPAFFEAWFNLGVAETSRGNLPAALAAYDKATILRPEDMRVLRNVGRLYLRQKDYAAAVEVFDRVRKTRPGDPQAHNDYGVALRRLGRPEEAARAFQDALKADSAYASAHYNLALNAADRGDLAMAEDHLERFLELSPNGADAPTARSYLEKLARDRKGSGT
jgi:Flp pilus assembly protein TadD